jgi:hypothetical protein
MLAELGYPPGDASLIPLREQVLNWLFSTSYSKYIRTINGRVRICASISANAILSILKLGLGDDRIDLLIKRIVDWQWMDGGWNCDKRPEACHSSFMESLLPLRALIQYAQNQGTLPVRSAIQRASELFLQHEIYKRTSDGSLILPGFLLLRHPRYWHYDILGSLIALEGAGRLNDPRCKPALIKLKEMRLPSGGYCANGKYYQLRQPELSQYSPVDWAPVRKGKTNLFITVEALTILQKSGLISSPEEKLDLKSLQAT